MCVPVARAAAVCVYPSSCSAASVIWLNSRSFFNSTNSACSDLFLSEGGTSLCSTIQNTGIRLPVERRIRSLRHLMNRHGLVSMFHAHQWIPFLLFVCNDVCLEVRLTGVTPGTGRSLEFSIRAILHGG